MNNLDKLLIKKGISPQSAEFEKIKKKLSFLSSVSESDIDFVRSKIKSKSDTEIQRKTDKELFEYSEALKYVRDKISNINHEMLIANLNFIEKRDKFFYKLSHLDAEISKARRLGWYIQIKEDS